MPNMPDLPYKPRGSAITRRATYAAKSALCACAGFYGQFCAMPLCGGLIALALCNPPYAVGLCLAGNAAWIASKRASDRAMRLARGDSAKK